MAQAVRERLYAMPGLIELEQGDRLAELAAGVPPEQAIVEIGSHTGLSTCWMAHAASAHVFAIDPWAPPQPGTSNDPFNLGTRVYQRFAENISSEGLWPRVTPLAARSLQVAKIWRQTIGLLFIDSLHSARSVRADVAAWAPFLAQGGWLALHDYTSDPAHPYHGVAIAADELERSGDWEVAPLVSSLWTARRR